jgi:hypothetical protein
MKGQLFISDVLVSLLIVTAIVAFTTWQLDQFYMRASDIEYNQISSVASDMSQLAVKNILANVSDGKTQPNVIDPAKWAMLENNMSEMIKQPYAYEADIPAAGLSLVSSNGGCDSKQNVAISRRIVYLGDIMGIDTLTVKVCI